MLGKLTKTETQKAIKQNLKTLGKFIEESKQPELDAMQKDIVKIKKALVLQNINLIIQAAFRGNQPEKSTVFDTSTDLMELLKPYFKRKIGEKRKEEIEKLIGEYFCPEAVNGLGIKCYISWYYHNIQFLYTENGFTHGSYNELIGIYFDNYQHKAEYPLDFENLTTTIPWEEEYISVSCILSEAKRIYKAQQKAVDKVNKLIGELNQVVESSRKGVPHNVQALENFVSVSHFMTRRLNTIDY